MPLPPSRSRVSFIPTIRFCLHVIGLPKRRQCSAGWESGFKSKYSESIWMKCGLRLGNHSGMWTLSFLYDSNLDLDFSFSFSPQISLRVWHRPLCFNGTSCSLSPSRVFLFCFFFPKHMKCVEKKHTDNQTPTIKLPLLLWY